MKANPTPLRVLFIASEADPLVKVGGLGDVAGSLPRALQALLPADLDGRQPDIRLALPFHSAITQKLPEIQLVASFTVPHATGEIAGRAFETKVQGVTVYLIEGAPIPPNAPVYNTQNSREDGEKYVFFSLAALEVVKKLDWKPDILHANDWHTATAVYALALRRASDPFFAETRSIISIHNLPFMGTGAEPVLTAYGIPPAQDERLPHWARLFPLPLALLTADHIVAVSPNYARELLTPAFGCGLQDFLSTRQDALSGIINGLEVSAWDPATDATLTANFNADNLEARAKNKQALLEEMGLSALPDAPLLIMIGRMDNQKGVDLAIEGLRLVTDQPWQAILLGTGDPLVESAARSLEVELPDRVRAAIRFDGKLARRLYASGDMLLMPSRYEPCGLAQMIAMRYGCVPVARQTGGLQDTIRDNREADGTGFLFGDASPTAFTVAVLRALALYPNRNAWREMQLRGMREDFSWQPSARAYGRLYLDLLQRPPLPRPEVGFSES